MSDLSRETRDLIARGRRGEGLSSDRRARLKSKMLASVAAGSVVTSSGAAAAAAWSALAAKVVGIAAIAAVVSGGAVLATRASRAPASSPASSPPLAPPTSLATHATAPAPTPTSAPPPATAAAAAASVPTPHAARALPPAPPRPRTTAVDTSLEEEARLVDDAQRALVSGDPASALRLADAHAARFPRGALAPESAALRVFALCDLGDTPRARVAAGAFLAAHPSGPLAARVRASCGVP